MSASKSMATIVRVSVTEGKTGLFFAESPELKRLLLAKPDMDSLWEAVPGAIRDPYRAIGQEVVVARVSDLEPGTGHLPLRRHPFRHSRRARERRPDRRGVDASLQRNIMLASGRSNCGRPTCRRSTSTAAT